MGTSGESGLGSRASVQSGRGQMAIGTLALSTQILLIQCSSQTSCLIRPRAMKALNS
jgi:hypothetical protein